jgi:death-on-curing protein
VTAFLSVADVIAIHALAMQATDEEPAPLLDERKLDAAVMRPRPAEHYESADVVRQAAYLAVGIVQAHAFLDGNKRCAYTAAATHLRLNGLRYAGAPRDVADLLLRVASGVSPEDGPVERLERFLRERIAPAP